MKNIVIGTTFIDIKGFPESDFMANGRNAGDIQYIHGGVGRNIAENLARCGLPPVFISGVDENPFAKDILQRLQTEGVNTDYIIRTEHALGTWLAVFNSDGDVVSSISKRPDLSKLTDIMDQQGKSLFKNADSISVEIDMDPEILDRVFCCAKSCGVPVFAVVSNMKIALEQDALKHDIFCLVCNRQEAELIVGSDLHSFSPEDLIGEIADRMSASSVEKMVVTLGEEGAVYFDRQTRDRGWIPSASVEVCDTTGAGDAFFSGVVMGLTGKKSLKEACKTGAQLAALVISTKENVCPRRAL